MAWVILGLAWIGAIGWPVALLLGWRARAARLAQVREERRRDTWSRRWRRPTRIAVLAGLTGVWALGVWAFLIEPELLMVRAQTVVSAAWRGPPLRIGLISDTHVGSPHVDGARMERVVARMNALHPDVVVLLGDYVGGHRSIARHTPQERADILRGLAAFGRLDAPLGTFAALGNHDWYYGIAAVEEGLAAAGVSVLENHAVRVARAGGPFWVAGLPDPVSNRSQPDFADALAPITDTAPIIAIGHRPDNFTFTPARVALTLAGHSHCGQVNLPVFGRVFAASPGARKWPCGAYDDGGRKLFVTGGVGVSMIPARFGAPPEIVVLTLTGEETDRAP